MRKTLVIGALLLPGMVVAQSTTGLFQTKPTEVIYVLENMTVMRTVLGPPVARAEVKDVLSQMKNGTPLVRVKYEKAGEVVNAWIPAGSIKGIYVQRSQQTPEQVEAKFLKEEGR